VQKSDEDLVNPIMTFPIKERINTALFIDGKYELYIHTKRIKGVDQTSEREVEKTGSAAENR